MALDEKILKDFPERPDKNKQQKDIEVMMDDIIDTNKEALLELAE